MSIHHHPPADMLASFAAGTLDQGRHVVLATHLHHCPVCRAQAASFEHVGGELLAALPPSAMSADASARATAILDRAASPRPPLPAAGIADVPGLPTFVRRLPAETWAWVAPGLQVRRLSVGPASATRVFLLKSRAGAKFLRHRHTDFEMTCVLAGSFGHDRNRYAVGDLDIGTPDIEHAIEIGGEGPCVSIVAMQGELKLTGLLGRLLQPLMRL
ncbi:MAG: ChrR family anti-sigma-E factor [Rhodospirillaceae bacterium]|nr:ChrR family anti-sigma-E factor [Rhodospirillaceae bacterium]